MESVHILIVQCGFRVPHHISIATETPWIWNGPLWQGRDTETVSRTLGRPENRVEPGGWMLGWSTLRRRVHCFRAQSAGSAAVSDVDADADGLADGEGADPDIGSGSPDIGSGSPDDRFLMVGHRCQ